MLAWQFADDLARGDRMSINRPPLRVSAKKRYLSKSFRADSAVEAAPALLAIW
jgi:hypothetical protein